MPTEFCKALATRQFQVIRFDNRDVGLSTWLDELGELDVPALFGGDVSSVRYHLSDMAADTRGLLEALGVQRAHLVGLSMGGMIAVEDSDNSNGTPAQHRWAADRSGARVAVLDGASHWWPSENPKPAAEVLTRFWRTLEN
jgi:pimeloyl-ACP methyl ester carboxylesterase